MVEMLPDLMTGVVHSNRSMLLWMMMGKGSPTDNEKDVIIKPIEVYTASRAYKFNEGKLYIKANRKRRNPFTPWTTLIPENIHNPFSKTLNPEDVEEICFETDMIIFSTGGSSEDSMYYRLKEMKAAKEIYAVGDCSKPARAWEAITAANDVARSI